MFCTNCGKEIPDSSQFCKFCGNKIAISQPNDITTNSISQPANNDSKTIHVTFHRQKKFTGCLVPMRIYIDKNIVATLDNDQSFEMDVPCGTHSVIVEMWSASSETQVEFSAEYTKMYIDVGIKMGLISNKAEILSIKNEK